MNETLAQRLVETDLMDILFAIHDVKDIALINDKVRSNFSSEKFHSKFFFFSLESTNRLGNRSTMFEIQIDSTEQRSTDSFLSKSTHLHSFFLIILFIKINNLWAKKITRHQSEKVNREFG